MKHCLAFLAGFGLAVVAADRAQAQASSTDAAATGFNPFATFSLNRFSFNTLGFLQVEPSSPFVATSGTTAASGGESEEEAAPQPVVIRPPFRPPVRSPYRPPPRPPF